MKTMLTLLGMLLISMSIQASPLSEAIAKRVEQSPQLRGEFKQQKKLALLPQPLQSSGEFLYSEQHGLLWHTQQPLDSQIIFTPSGIFRSGESVTPGSSANMQHAMRIFSQLFFALIRADLDSLEQLFVIDGKNDAKQWVLNLSPRPGDISRMIKSLQLQGDRQLQQARFVDINGDETTIHFSKQNTQPLNAEEQQRFAR